MHKVPLQITGLGHEYGNSTVLNQVNLTVHPGEFVALLGPSGCGKTTLLRSIAGLLTPNRGEIKLSETVVVEKGHNLVETESRGVGLVFQEYALFPHMTVTQNVGFGLQTADAQRVANVLACVDMTDFGDRYPSQLSGGQQQRVALARALAPRPDLLLLDEPFANIDAILRDSLGRELLRVVRQEGAAALLVTHDQHSALSMADRVVILDEHTTGSSILQDASPAIVYQSPSTESVAALTGECCVLDGTANGDHADTIIGPVPLANSSTGPVRIIIRPHSLQFVPHSDGAFRVNDVRYTGASYRLYITGNDQRFETDLAGSETPPVVGSTGHLKACSPCWAI
ncbi:MAG: ABC transporter ATP-binding protein [Myxococcota bacterium]